MKAKGHLETYNHFSLVAKDTALCLDAWEKAFNVKIPGMTETPEEMPDNLMELFERKPTYRGKPWPAAQEGAEAQPLLAPFYQPGRKMIEVKAPGSIPSMTDFYERFGNGIQYFGIVEGDNRDPFIDALKESYGVEKLEEMFYDPLPGDFCIVETEPLIGFNLCVKQDGALNGKVEESIPATVEAMVIVPNIDQAVETWVDLFDIEKPEIQTIVEKTVIRGQETMSCFCAARIKEMPFPLYLVQSGPVSPFAEFAQKNGYGIHHITFDVKEDPAVFTQRMQNELQIGILAEYDLEGAHYILFDSAEKMGAVIGILFR